MTYRASNWSNDAEFESGGKRRCCSPFGCCCCCCFFSFPPSFAEDLRRKYDLLCIGRLGSLSNGYTPMRLVSACNVWYRETVESRDPPAVGVVFCRSNVIASRWLTASVQVGPQRRLLSKPATPRLWTVARFPLMRPRRGPGKRPVLKPAKISRLC